jgi:hypothetical protein
VRTVLELVQNELQYTNRFQHIVGPFDEAIRNISKNFSYSEIYEIGALGNILNCKIRSIYPRIQYGSHLDILNSTFDAMPGSFWSPTIYLFWTHTQSEVEARRNNSNNWSPNHFVPLLLPFHDHTPQTDRSLQNTYSLVRLYF